MTPTPKPAETLESLARQWREKALVCSSERQIATLETCANQLDSYLAIERERRKELEGLRDEATAREEWIASCKEFEANGAVQKGFYEWWAKRLTALLDNWR